MKSALFRHPPDEPEQKIRASDHLSVKEPSAPAQPLMMSWRAASQRPLRLQDAFHVVHFTAASWDQSQEADGFRCSLVQMRGLRLCTGARRSSRMLIVSSQVLTRMLLKIKCDLFTISLLFVFFVSVHH